MRIFSEKVERWFLLIEPHLISQDECYSISERSPACLHMTQSLDQTQSSLIKMRKSSIRSVWSKSWTFYLSKLVTQLSPQTLTELNIQVAQFRDLLLAVGSAKDCPDLRERIRKVRMEAVEEVMRTNNSLLPHVKK